MKGACPDGRRHPRLRPIPHPLAPHSRPQPPEPPRPLPSDPAVTHDPQGNRLPGIDDISGFCGDMVQWGPCRCDPWDRWGWSSVIFQVRRYTPANLWMNKTDWRDLVRSTDAHTAASTLIYLAWSFDAPPPPYCVPQLLEHIRQAFNTPSLALSPHLCAVNTIRNTIDRKIVESLPEEGPVFLSPLKLPSLHDIESIWPKPGSIRRYRDSEHPHWLLIVNMGERVARERLLLPPDTWTGAERMIGPPLTAIASLTVFAERRPAPATLRFLQLVRSEFARPGYLRAGLRPRTRSILDRRPLLGQPQTQS